MVTFTKENYYEQIKKFKMETWRSLSLSEKEKLMQWIVDYKAAQFGLPSLCTVKIKNIKDGAHGGKFFHKTHELYIEKRLAEELLKPPYNKKHSNVLANKETFEVLMHEFCHALQQYVIEHPELYGEHEYYQLLVMNREDKQNNKLFAYFSLYCGDDPEKRELSSLLYTLQLSERDAMKFADDESKDFNVIMHTFFPDDPAFHFHDSFSQFYKRVEEAKDEFNTNHPFEDIDDIIRNINGVPTLNPLNKIMCQAVIKTQSKSFGERLIESLSLSHENISDMEMNGEGIDREI